MKIHPDDLDLAALAKKARQLRATCVQLAHDGKEGHLNGALSCVEILIALYYFWLDISPENPKKPNRDRFIFSKGHSCAALYGVMADCGFFAKPLLARYAHDDSSLPSHPCIHALPLLESSAGSLGHGLGIASGISYALRLDANKARVAVLASDGECNEGSTWEAAMFAAAKHLENLLLIVDYNGIQSVGRSDELMGHASLAEKFKAFGWGVRKVNGLDIAAVVGALREFPFEMRRPSAIIAKTVAGAGISFMEDQVLWHYRVPSDEDLKRALAELKEAPIHFGPVP